MEDSIKPADKFREMLSHYPGKLSSENVPIHCLPGPVLELERGMLFCDGSGLPETHFFSCVGSTPSPGRLRYETWEEEKLAFADWNIFIGMNNRGLITFVLLRHGFENQNQLFWVLHSLEPLEIATLWRQKIHTEKQRA